MFKWVVILIGLVSLPAFAQESDGDAVAFQDVGAAVEGAMTAEEEKRKARLEALEALNKGKQARVVILKQEDVDYNNDTVQRLVKARILRPDAKFYPDIDLYQAGRREPDRKLRPIDQRGMVGEDSILDVNAAVEQVSMIPWNQLTEMEWGLKAQELKKLADELWFMDRAEVREPLFMLYSQIGRAAENMNNTSPPFYASIDGQTLNYYWFLAGAMAQQDPAMLSLVTDADVNESIKYYKEELDSGGIGLMTLSFEEGGAWDVKGFASEYVVYINGLEVLIDAPDGLYQVPPGRVDVFLERSDGMSISDRIVLDKLGDKIYFVRDVARKRMGIDFAAQLMDHPNECTPELDGDILTYLNIYAKIHPEAEVYIGVPIAGNPNHVGIWRFDRPSGTLQKVLEEGSSFPVRFAGLLNVGVAIGGYQVNSATYDPNAGGFDAPSLDFALTGLPIDLQLRAHFVRLMVVAGVSFTLGLDGVDPTDPLAGASFLDYYQTGSFDVKDSGDSSQLRGVAISTTSYFGAGMVLGKNAAVGYGPRGYFRVGFTNVPHVVDLTLHPGFTMKAPIPGFENRIRPIIDFDLYGGVMIPYGRSVFKEGDGRGSITEVPWVVGLTAGVGSTF